VRGSLRAVRGLVVVLLAAFVLPLGAGAAVAAPRDETPAAGEPAGAVSGGESAGVVVVGVGGLHWTDVDRSTVPTLWRMVEQGSVASISVRTVNPETCPLDAWLTLSAGRRTPAPAPLEPPEVPASADPTLDCTPVPPAAEVDPGRRGPAPYLVTGWSSLVEALAARETETGAPGTVGSRVSTAGACTTAIGAGAAVALADGTGVVQRYVRDVADLTPGQLVACPVVVVDGGELSPDAGTRQDELRALDRTLRQVLDAVPDGWRVVVAGVSDTPVEELGLQVVVDWHAGGGPVGWLTSDSTRRPGIVTLADLAATVVATVGGDITDFDGSPLTVDSPRRMSADRTVENRRYLTEMTTTIPHLMPVFIGVTALAALLALAVALRTGRAGTVGAPRSATGAARRAVTRRVTTAVLLLAACAPAGAYLAALSRWWVAAAPLVVATVSCAVATLLVALMAWALSRVLPPGPWRVGGSVAAVTWLVLTVDGLTGTVLQQGSVLGATLTLGARFYGFGNTAFAVYASAALVLAGALAAVARRRHPRWAVPAVAAVGVVTVVVDGWPAFGADLGGILALVPAFAVLLIGVTGRSVTSVRALLVGALAVLVVVVVAVVDWLLPGPGSHLGLFVQRVLDGDALGVVGSKAAGAWATIAQPGGAVGALVCLVVAVALVGPVRWRPAAVRGLYARWPLLHQVVAAVVVVGLLGAALNDSGVSVALVVLLAAGSLLAVSGCADRAQVPDAVGGERDAPVRRMPSVVVAASGGMLLALLLVAAATPTSPSAAGDVARGGGVPVVGTGAPLVVVGTQGVRWQDVTRSATPTLWGMVRDGSAVGGVAPGVTGTSARCGSAGWLSLSAGRAPVTGQSVDGEWVCAPWEVRSDGGSAAIEGWTDLETLQRRSAFRPRLGVLGQALDTAGACSTAVGPGAALALAGEDGRVGRYRDLDAALTDPADAFSCPVTVVDAGSAPFVVPTADPAATDDQDLAVDADAAAVAPDVAGDGPGVAGDGSDTAGADEDVAVVDRDAAVRAVDATVRRVLQAAPDGAVVLVVDVGNPAPGRPWLGVGAVATDPSSRFLSTASTRWEGVVRLLDVPTSVLAAVGAGNPSDFTGAPLVAAGARPSDVGTAVDQLADLTVRDHALRGLSGTVTTTPLVVGLVVLVLVLLLGPRLATRRPGAAVRLLRAVEGLLLVLGALPVAMFLMTLSSWWRMPGPPALAMWGSLAVVTLAVAGLAGLAPRRPVWSAPALLALLTFGVLTLDAALGTPLHRGSPLGPSPTLGGRYYGFGNPTYSVYAVAALVTAAALGTWLLRRGRRLLAVTVAAVVAGVALVVDLWPALGADVGGGLVLVPAGAVVVLAVAGVRLTWRRLLLTGVAGVVLVGAIGVLDWLRPADERSHLGIFVQSVLDGTAWQTVARKAGYAARTVVAGPSAWLTLAVLVVTVLLLWPPRRRVAAWFARMEERWPLVRAVLVGLLVAAVGGAVVNDYGVRIATVMLFAAVPLVGLLVLRAQEASGGPAVRWSSGRAAAAPVSGARDPAGQPAEPTTLPATASPRTRPLEDR